MGGVGGENTEDEVARERNIRNKAFLFCFFFCGMYYSRETRTPRNTPEQLGKPVWNYITKLMSVKDLASRNSDLYYLQINSRALRKWITTSFKSMQWRHGVGQWVTCTCTCFQIRKCLKGERNLVVFLWILHWSCLTPHPRLISREKCQKLGIFDRWSEFIVDARWDDQV